MEERTDRESAAGWGGPC